MHGSRATSPNDAAAPARRGLLALAAAALLAIGCAEEPPEPAETGATRWLNQDPAVRYVGIDECRDCHLGIYSTYRQTGMGRAFYPLTPDNLVEDFERDNEIEVARTGIRYRMFEREGRFYQRQFLVDSQGRELAGEERELVFVVGSNNHSRSYITLVDDKMFQAPVCWYPQVERWDLCPGYEVKNEHFGREISTSCLWCHNGRMELVEGERNRFRRPFPHGIGCERCHGPGQLHVERWRKSGEAGTGEADPTIVNPRRLEPRARLDVCFQCHLGDAKATVRVGRHGRDVQDFRPGRLLSEFVVPFHYAEQTQWDFGLSAQADRMVLSRCFEASGGKLECLTCHNPHVSVYASDRPADYFRRKCLTCHEVDDCAETMESRTTEHGDDCVSCHMRRAEPDDQRFTEFTDHWIRRDVALAEPDHRASYEIAPFFAEDLAGIPRGEQHYYRGRAAYLLAMDAPRSRYAEMWHSAETELRQALERGYENADVWFFLGKTLELQGRRAEATEAYRTALDFDRAHHDASFAFGKSLADAGRPDEAIAVFRRMLEQDPTDAMALSELARSLFATGRADEALEALRRGVAEEPWDPTLQINLGMTLAAHGRMADAADVGRVAIGLDPDLTDSWILFVNASREAGRIELAREGQAFLEKLQASTRP